MLLKSPRLWIHNLAVSTSECDASPTKSNELVSIHIGLVLLATQAPPVAKGIACTSCGTGRVRSYSNYGPSGNQESSKQTCMSGG